MLATFALQSSGFRRKLKGVFDLWKKIQMADKIRNHSVPMTSRLSQKSLVAKHPHRYPSQRPNLSTNRHSRLQTGR